MKPKSRYSKEIVESKFDMHPAEGLVRCLKGQYPRLPIIPKSGRVLDAGCGEGRHSRFLHKLDYEVYGFEVDEAIVDSLKEKVPGVEFRVGLNNRIPFSESFFDLVVSWQSLYYLETDTSGDIEDNIREVSRVTKPGGTLISCIPFQDNFIYNDSVIVNEVGGVKYRKIHDYFGQRTGIVLASFDTPRVFTSLLDDFGFDGHEIGEMTGDWFGLSYRWFVTISKKAEEGF